MQWKGAVGMSYGTQANYCSFEKKTPTSAQSSTYQQPEDNEDNKKGKKKSV
jgi:hypothetical protein